MSQFVWGNQVHTWFPVIIINPIILKSDRSLMLSFVTSLPWALCNLSLVHLPLCLPLQTHSPLLFFNYLWEDRSKSICNINFIIYKWIRYYRLTITPRNIYFIFTDLRCHWWHYVYTYTFPDFMETLCNWYLKITKLVKITICWL